MPQTLPNGIPVPINADAYNLTADLATMGNGSNVVIPVANQAARDALVPFAGMTVCRLDLAGAPVQIYDGTTWQTGYAALSLLAGSGVTDTGTVTLTYVGGLTIANINLQFSFTGSTALSTSYVNLGTPIPVAARSATAPLYYGSSWLNGGGAGFNAPIGTFVNPSTGQLQVRLQSGTATTSAGVIFSLNTFWVV